MAGREKIIHKIISEIDWYMIEKVRELRKAKFSQVALSIEIGFAEGFIGRIENPNYSSIYSSRHLNLIAKALKVDLNDIVPKKAMENDLIQLIIKIHPPTKLKSGEKNYEVIGKKVLTEEEVKAYNSNKLSRPSKSGQTPQYKKRRPQ